MKKILFIEDNLCELEYVKKELESAGFEYDTAGGTSAAEELLKKRKYDCLIIDLNMNNTHIPAEYKNETESGEMTGWVWLYRVVEPSQLAGPSAKFIIYSAFIKELNERIDNPGRKQEEFNLFYSSRIKCITKANAVNGENELEKTIIDILGDSKK